MLNFIYISAPVQTIVRCLDTRWSADLASCIRDCNWIERRLQLYKVECPECIHSTAGRDGSIEPPNMLGRVRSIHQMASILILMDPLSHDPMDMRRPIDHRLLCWWWQRVVQFRWLKVESKLLRTQHLGNYFVKNTKSFSWKSKFSLSQTGSGPLQLPLAKQLISGVPINAFPLLHENWTFVPNWVAVVLKARPLRGVISLQWTALTSTMTACVCRAGVMQV